MIAFDLSRLLPPPLTKSLHTGTVLLALSALALHTGHAQHDARDDTPFVAHLAPEDPHLAKVAMVRVWYVGGPDAPAVALAREPQGKKVVLIDNNLRPGLLSAYFPVKPGDFSLHILRGDTRPPSEENGELPLQESKLAEPFEVDLRPGGYSTIVVHESAGLLKARLVIDEAPKKNAAPVLRVHDFSGLPGWKIRVVDDPMGKSVKAEVWNSLSVGDAPVSLPQSGKCFLQMAREIDGVTREVGTFEAMLPAGSACSVVLFSGRRGKGAAQLVFDATPGRLYNAEEIKAVAGGMETSQ